ncbi:MAG: DUF2190 family protein [Phycisphaerales bacterium]|nr:DUF2190 family protein [Phycisphaerales bacterium]
MANPITNPLGFGGYTDFQTLVGGFDLEFKAGAAIDAKQVVAIGTDGTISEAATDSTAALQVGISLDSASTGDVIKVRVFGAVDNVPAAGAVTAGLVLKRSVTTTGSVSATATPVAGEAIGFAIAASASNLVDVFVCKSL